MRRKALTFVISAVGAVVSALALGQSPPPIRLALSATGPLRQQGAERRGAFGLARRDGRRRADRAAGQFVGHRGRADRPDAHHAPGVKFDVEGSGYGFRVVKTIPGVRAEMQITCRMSRAA